MKTIKPSKRKKNQDINCISVLELLKHLETNLATELSDLPTKLTFPAYTRSHANFLYLINMYSAYRFILLVFLFKINLMHWPIWYHFYNLKIVKNTHRRVLILVKLQAEACNFTKINNLPWVFFTFFKLYKWYQIAQRITNQV